MTFIVYPFCQDWAQLHRVLIKFYGYQRAGLKPTAGNPSGNPYNPFYTKPGDDGKYPHANDAMDGGWYDAGDFVKFGLPQGFATYCLLKGYDAFPKGYDDLDSWNYSGKPDGIADILNEAKVGTDYLIKCIKSSNEIVLDIGDGKADHGSLNESGYANSNRLNNRSVFLWANGADAPGYYGAALALMSQLYKKHDADYSALCLQKAKEAFDFCRKHQKLSDTQKDHSGLPFYKTDTWKDKMGCAAIELFRATGDSVYLVWAKDMMIATGQHYDALGYANGGDFLAFELYRLGEKSLAAKWLADVNTAINRVVTTPGKLVTGATVNSVDWGVCRTAANAAFSAALAYIATGDSKYRDFAFQQIKWIAGISPYTRSYITQYGNSFPQNPHHRNDNTISGVRLVGAIVSGPTATNCPPGGTNVGDCVWTFNDSRDSYRNTEPALDYNAGAVGAVGFIRYYLLPNNEIRINEPLKAQPDIVDFDKVGSVKITMELEKSIQWKILLKGERSGAVKNFIGTGQSISIGWKAEADSGTFVSGEKILMKLDVPNIWEPQRQTMAEGSFYLMKLKTEPFTVNDKLLDNFEDSVLLTNAVGGRWSGFSDLSDSVAGGASIMPTIATDKGAENSKGIIFRLYRKAGAKIPYCGIKTTFNSSGSAVSLGAAKSVVFDIKPLNDFSSLRVELEQTDISPREYYGYDVVLGLKDEWYRVRIPFQSMSQPKWKSMSKTFNSQNVVSLVFCGYGEANERFILDNIRIENMDLGSAHVIIGKTSHSGKSNVDGFAAFKANRNGFCYVFSAQEVKNEIGVIELFDVRGKLLYRELMSHKTPSIYVAVKNINLYPGTYILYHTLDKKIYLKSFLISN